MSMRARTSFTYGVMGKALDISANAPTLYAVIELVY